MKILGFEKKKKNKKMVVKKISGQKMIRHNGTIEIQITI
jgi:hypothetical protein